MLRNWIIAEELNEDARLHRETTKCISIIRYKGGEHPRILITTQGGALREKVTHIAHYAVIAVSAASPPEKCNWHGKEWELVENPSEIDEDRPVIILVEEVASDFWFSNDGAWVRFDFSSNQNLDHAEIRSLRSLYQPCLRSLLGNPTPHGKAWEHFDIAALSMSIGSCVSCHFNYRQMGLKDIIPKPERRQSFFTNWLYMIKKHGAWLWVETHYGGASQGAGHDAPDHRILELKIPDDEAKAGPPPRFDPKHLRMLRVKKNKPGAPKKGRAAARLTNADLSRRGDSDKTVKRRDRLYDAELKRKKKKPKLDPTLARFVRRPPDGPDPGSGSSIPVAGFHSGMS